MYENYQKHLQEYIEAKIKFPRIPLMSNLCIFILLRIYVHSIIHLGENASVVYDFFQVGEYTILYLAKNFGMLFIRLNTRSGVINELTKW